MDELLPAILSSNVRHNTELAFSLTFKITYLDHIYIFMNLVVDDKPTSNKKKLTKSEW
jgi:hypothetical protein